MIKLLNAYQADPSDKNASKAYAYYNRHAMAACLLTIEQGETLSLVISHYRKLNPSSGNDSLLIIGG